MASEDVGARFGRFRHDSAGIREIFTSAAMQAELARLALSTATKANAIARTHHVDHRPAEDAYKANVHVGRDTAMGFVNRNGRVGRLDQSMYHTLDAINH